MSRMKHILRVQTQVMFLYVYHALFWRSISISKASLWKSYF